MISATPGVLAASCAAGQYNNKASVCTPCPSPELYSLGGLATTCSTCPPGTMISGAACTACAAGKFSAFKASTACQACPSGTGSLASASACVRCNPAAKLANGITACPDCAAACTACAAGRYNEGKTKRCIGCSAGKFSTVPQAVSPNTCSPCPAGQTTLPTTTGATACVPCDAISAPRSASFITAPDPLVCDWACSSGYTRFNYSEAAYSPTTYTALGYTAAQGVVIYHNRNDFCCEPSTTKVGMYMCGTALPACAPACTRTADGESSHCAAIGNAYFVVLEKYKFNRCADWVCNEFFFLNKTSGICIAQPVCQAGWTYQRDTVAGACVSQPSGSFTCVPCTQCIDGSETTTPCNRINDTVCSICSSAEYSYQASKCSPTVPFGFSPVRIRLTAIPVFQGRPSMFSDTTPVQWNDVDFVQGFFLNSYTPCQPAALASLMFIGGDETCDRLDLSGAICALPICKTQCRPWNGADGWYRLKTGECSRCVYDPTCSSLQYSDMSVCGPTTAPRCLPCPAIPLPNSLGWINPGRTPFPGPHTCDMICRDGFAKGGNYSCIPCPSMPSNSKITGGCNWTCSLGFVQDRTACIPCVGVPTACSVGYFIGYAAATSQCPRCLPCTNLVANAVYTSAGRPNGPNTCGISCVAGTFVSPGYGFDTYGNPVACDRCSSPLCEPGATYIERCSYLADANCIQCSECAAGAQVLTPCTPTANTTCVACDAAALPLYAAWTEPGCMVWECDAGFIRQPNTTTCLKCKVPHDCLPSDSYEDDDGTGCGRCVACDTGLLLPGQCFNGDGQCGVSYVCDEGMLVAQTPPQFTPAPQDAVIAAGEVSQPPPPPPIPVFASMATLTLLDSAPLTGAFLANIGAQMSADCECEATVTAVTQNNVTTFCSPTCTGLRRRRLLGQTLLYIDIALVSPTHMTHIPRQPACDGHTVVGWQAYECRSIGDPALLRDRRRLTVYFKRNGALWVVAEEEKPVEWGGVYTTMGAVVGMAILLSAAVGAIYCCRVPLKQREAQEADVRPVVVIRQSASCSRREREWRPPAGYRSESW